MKTVFVVEDSPLDRHLATPTPERRGVSAPTTSSGTEILAIPVATYAAGGAPA